MSDQRNSKHKIEEELENASIRLVKCKWQYQFKKVNAKNFIYKSVKSSLELLPNIADIPRILSRFCIHPFRLTIRTTFFSCYYFH